MRGDARDPDLGCIPFEHLPHNFLAEPFAGDASPAIHRSENMIGGDAGCGSLGVDRYLHPCWHRRGPHASVFSHEIDDTPSSVTLLQMRKCERRHFRSAQSAAKKNREDGAVAQTTYLRDIRSAQEGLGLPL